MMSPRANELPPPAPRSDPGRARRGLVPLRTVLWIKIGVTVALWCTPLLLAPCGVFRALGFPAPGTLIVFLRLLGAAYLALLVGYVRAYRALRAGLHPGDAVAVGIVSNAGGSLILLGYGMAGAYAGWGGWAQAYMWVSAAAAGLIALGLATADRGPGGAPSRSAALDAPGEGWIAHLPPLYHYQSASRRP